MINKSLNNIMNEMARCSTIVRSAAPLISKIKTLDEIEAFSILDDTLCFLNKQYLEAKTQRQELVKLSSADDPMALVALDMEDSAWCAMQTRYIEVRENRKMMARAQQMIRQRERQIEELEERILQSEKLKQAHDFINYLKILKIMKDKNKTPKIFEWVMACLILRIDILGMSFNRHSYNITSP